jgi:Putative Flp pilus-assembly TadE/G-like
MVLPLLAIGLVVMVGFLALAIDLGMMAIASTQIQQAADLSALTAMRTMNGNSGINYNQSAATTNAQNVVTYNSILGQSLQSSQLQLSFGSYDYNATTGSFQANFPPTSGAPETAVTATITSSGMPSSFSKIWKTQWLPNVSATAQAVHRPRDIALVLDLSGSMRFGTCLGFDFYPTSRTSNNPDPLIPTFGQYSSANAGLQGPSTNQTSGDDNYTISPSNTTAPNSSYSLTFVNNFIQDAPYTTPWVRAFDSYTSSNSGVTWTASTTGTPQLPAASFASVPGGDVPLFKSGSTTTYATDVKDVVGTANRNPSWELDGYSNYVNGSLTSPLATSGQSNYNNAPFSGYTQGPGYYGQTFFIWPPDPRRPLNTGTATAWSTTANDTATIKQFLADFGYAASDFGNSAFTTTLSAAVTTTTATSLTVVSKASFPILANYYILIDSEVLKVTGGANTTSWTVTRGFNGTTAATHLSGKTVALWSGPPLTGLYTAASTGALPNKTLPTSQTWPWPNDGGATLNTYLTTYVYTPSSAGNPPHLLGTADAAYQQIMRLYNWNYVIDNVGTTPCDWRIRFFGTDDNTVLLNGSGSLDVPGNSTYTINYNEILRWITQTLSPSDSLTNPFPAQLHGGRLTYYGSIPTAITGTWPSYGSTDQRFWVEFIDHVLGFRQTAAGVYTDISGMAGYGSDFTWGTTSQSTNPSATQYMSYTDNPLRPNLRYWFSPILLVDYLHNYNMDTNVANYFYMQPGDSYEAPNYTAKQAYVAAVATMQNNHPNDWVTLAAYSWPRTSAADTNGRLNCVRCPLGTNYNYASAALLFPFGTINADGSPNHTEINPYTADPATGLIPSSDFTDAPRGDGDTSFAMALMLCHNQFAVTLPTDTTLRSFTASSPITFPTGMAGGMGRKGAQKVVIFETDGMANCSATANLVTSGSYSYYKIRYDMNNPNSSEYPSIVAADINDPTVLSQVYSLIQQLVTSYGTTRNPFRLYALGFGPVFQGSDASAAQTTLQTMQYYAGTQASASTALPSNQIITGTDTQMSTNMINTFTKILENGVQIALVK